MGKKLCVLALLLGGMLLGLACAAKETTPAPAEPAAVPAPAAPAPAAAPEAKPAWQEEWERVLGAAKREGKVAVAGPPGADSRQALTEPFERKYGISVEYLGGRGSVFAPRIQAERAAGQYLWDIHIGGTSTTIINLKPIGAVDPLEPTLILPEVKDPKNWKGGKLHYAGRDRVNLSFIQQQYAPLCLNSKLAKAEEFKSYKDLLDPKWKGKMLVHDPRLTGGAQAMFHLFYVHPELGPDFIRALLTRELRMATGVGQLMEWLAVGRAPIMLGCSGPTALRLIKEGLPIQFIDPGQMKEGGSLHAGLGSVVLVNRAPHPNAAKVYINWLLTKEAQTAYSRASALPSLRVDVPTAHLPPWKVPKEGVSYIMLEGEEAVLQRANVVFPFLQEVLGPR